MPYEQQWMSPRNLLALAAILIAITIFYYFLVRPMQEKRAYAECSATLNDVMYSSLPASQKEFLMESCVKSGGADKVPKTMTRAEFEAKKAKAEAKP